jgi:hypothetical protein
VSSIRILLPHLVEILSEHLSEELRRVDAMRGIVGASVNATWLFLVMAQIARSGFANLALARGVVTVKFVDRNVAVWAICGAEPATYAPILDDDFERVTAANRTDRAADHTERVSALPARGGDKVFVEANTVAK